jgi:hypothetical protein
MNAKEAKTTAEKFLLSRADELYEKIKVAANLGQFCIIVYPSEINDQVKKILEGDGYKVEYRPESSYDRFSMPDYKISWE